jgi:hypothetical protein
VIASTTLPFFSPHITQSLFCSRDVEEKLKRLPAPAAANEKRRILETGLKQLETVCFTLAMRGMRNNTFQRQI